MANRTVKRSSNSAKPWSTATTGLPSRRPGSAAAVGQRPNQARLKSGDRIAVLEGDSKEAADFFLGAGIANLVRVPLYPRNSADAHLHMVEHTGCRALIVAGNHALEVADFKHRLPSLEHLIVRDQRYASEPTGLLNRRPDIPSVALRVRSWPEAEHRGCHLHVSLPKKDRTGSG